MKAKKYLLSISICFCLATFILLLTESCKQKPAEAPTKTTVIVGYLPVSTTLPNWVAKAEGFAGKQGLEIQFERYANSNLLLMGLLNGEVHATSVCADEPVLTAVSNGQKGFEIYLQEVLTQEQIFDAIITKRDSSIENISDLDGKTVACFPGSQLKAYLQIILKQAGLNPGSVNIIQLPPPNMIPALISGTVDACFALEPIITVAIQKDIAKIIVPSPISKYINKKKPLCAASYLISSKWADENPKAADAFIESVYDAVNFIRTDYERAAKYYPEFTPIEKEMAGKVVITDFATIDSPDIDGLKKEIQVLQEAGVIKSRITVEQLIYKRRTKD